MEQKFDYKQAETAVLGAIITDAPTYFGLCQEKNVSAEHFQVPVNSIVYKVIVNLAQEIGVQYVDLITVCDRMRRDNLLETIGGEINVHRMVEAVTAISHTEFFIQQLQSQWLTEQVRLLHLKLGDNVTSHDDPKDVLCELVSSAADLIHRDERGLSFTERYARLRGRFTAAQGEGGKAFGYPSAWDRVQNILGGAVPEEMVVIGAKRSTGKTTFVCNELLHKAKKFNVASGFVAIDTGEDTLWNTIIACQADVSQFKLRLGTASDEEIQRMDEAADLIKDLPIYVTGEVRTIDGIEAWATAQVARHDIKILVVDFFQRITGGKGGNQTEQETDISGRLKALAKRLHINVVVLSQFLKTDGGFGRKVAPSTEILRGSAMLGDDADAVILLYKDPAVNYGEMFADADWPIVVDISKNRFGPTGKTKLLFVRKRQRFEEPFFDEHPQKDMPE